MLQIEGVGARFAERQVLHDIELAVGEGELVSVLGPSGSGKTTLLRLIAGLEKPSSGRIRWNGADLADVPVHQRGFGLMFQDYALFPHRDVFDNVAFGLRMHGDGRGDRAAIERRVAEVLQLVGLAGLERRSVNRLSGGEQQRIALARALAPSPRLLMLDEPLGSLDRSLRERLPGELRAIFERVGATVIYVTHDQEEALSVADRTIVLRDGEIDADAAPQELWLRPPTEFVARFLGFGNVAPAIVGGGVARTPWGEAPLDERAGGGAEPGRGGGQPMTERWVVLRPDAFVPDPRGPIRGSVLTRTFRGDHVRLQVDVAGGPPLEVDARWEPLPEVGTEIVLRIEPRGVVVLGERG